MLIENQTKHTFRLTLTGYELAALISSARWAAEGATGELSPDAVDHLRQVLANYDRAAANMKEIRQPGQTQAAS